MMLREVAYVNAHIAPHGSKIDAFKAVTNALNKNVDFSPVVEAKSIRDRYERLQKNFYSDDRRDALKSGVGGDFTES